MLIKKVETYRCQDVEEAVEKEILPTYKNKLIF